MVEGIRIVCGCLRLFCWFVRDKVVVGAYGTLLLRHGRCVGTMVAILSNACLIDFNSFFSLQVRFLSALGSMQVRYKFATGSMQVRYFFATHSLSLRFLLTLSLLSIRSGWWRKFLPFRLSVAGRSAIDSRLCCVGYGYPFCPLFMGYWRHDGALVWRALLFDDCL